MVFSMTSHEPNGQALNSEIGKVSDAWPKIAPDNLSCTSGPRINWTPKKIHREASKTWKKLAIA
jgi:hypothetical protein